VGDGATTLQLRLTCLNLPSGPSGATEYEFGLQDKKQELVPGIAGSDGAVHYDLSVEAVRYDGSPAVRFRGPFVHGTPSVPFLYLSLRRTGAAPNDWIRRLKIPLTGIDWPKIEAASAPASNGLAATVSGQRSGTVPLLGDGWQPIESPAE